MLVIISDLHLTDGTSGRTIKAAAFKAFRERVRDLAYDASWRQDGKYRPIEALDILLLGDILDVIRSDTWLEGKVRPWDKYSNQAFQNRVAAINKAILRNNADCLGVLKSLHAPNVMTIPRATDGKPAKVGHDPDAEGRVPVKVGIHYMVGNHDWFYHCPGGAFNTIRKAVVRAAGLANKPSEPFPHDPLESPAIEQLLQDHRVFARHGDIYDPFNFELDRDASSLGDAIVIELLNRFPGVVKEQLGKELPPEVLTGLCEIDNVRPLLLVPAWLNGLLKRLCPDPQLVKKVKKLWDGVASDFLKLPFVRKRDKFFNFNDLVDQLECALLFSKGLSLGRLSSLLNWWNERTAGGEKSFREHAMAERAFKNRTAEFVVYGHTHRHEIVPLDVYYGTRGEIKQLYVNSGTWRCVHELAQFSPRDEEFVESYVLTFLAFFKDDERGGRKYEFWSGTLGTEPLGA